MSIALPFRITIPGPISPALFAHLSTAIKSSNRVKHYTELSPLTGKVSTSDADFDYEYDGASTVVVTVTALNSWLARHASASQIQSHILVDMNEFVRV